MKERAAECAQAVRVAVVSSVHRWNDTRIYVRESRSLAQAGYDVLLVAVAAEHQPAETDGLQVHPLPRRKRSMRWVNWLGILRAVIKHRAKIVHAHDPELFPLLFLLRLFGCRVVCDVHENFAQQILSKEWIPAWMRGGMSAIVRQMQRNLPRLANAVVLAEDSYVADFIQANNIIVVRNFPSLPDLYKRNYESDGLRLVYVGDVRIVRGVETYVRLTDRLVRMGLPVRTWIIGSFADPHEEELIKALIGELDLEDRVLLLGRRRPEEIPELLVQCDIGLSLLHPIGNYRESYPTKMFEYMAAGLPVIASNFELWKNVLVSNSCGTVVDPLDTKEAALAVRDYWSQPGRREREGRNGRAAVIEHYQWSAEARRLLDGYARLSPAVTWARQSQRPR